MLDIVSSPKKDGGFRMDINLLTKAITHISKNIDSELQLQTLRAFLFIAQRGSCSQKDVENELGITNASASRNVSYWTDRRFDRKPGLGFVERVEDEYDRRYKTLTLTLKGRDFFEQLRSL